MALHEPFTISFNNSGSTRHTFTHRVGSYAIWSDDDDYYVEPDGTATTGSHLVPQNAYISHAIPCKTLDIRGKSGSGTVYGLGLWLTEADG